MFEFDPKKSHTNKEKHGIDFKEAQALWSETGVELSAKSMLDERARTKRLCIMQKKKTRKISSTELDKKFNDGKEDILEHFDVESANIRVLVDFPKWMLEILDDEANKLSIPRQAVIKTWLNDRIRSEKKVG